MKAYHLRPDPDRHKAIFFQIGMTLALSLCLLAFEWRSYPSPPILLTAHGFNGIEEDIVINTRQKPLPKPPRPRPVTVFHLVTTDIDIPDIVIDVEDNLLKPLEPWEPVLEEEKADSTPDFYLIPEVMPSFAGGTAALHRYLANHIVYPQAAREAGIDGTVYLSFIIDKAGKPTQLKVLRGIGGGCDEEALRVAAGMPAWSPGLQRGRPVKVAMNLPVHFLLK